MIDHAGAAQKFLSELLSSWGRRDNYNPRIFPCKSLDVAMDRTHQEKEILTSEGIRILERMNIIYVEVKWLRHLAVRSTTTCN